MSTIHLANLQSDYIGLVNLIAETGAPSAPRGLPTKELIGAQLVFEDTTNMLPVGIGRGVSTALNAAHATSIIAGRDLDALMHRIAPRLSEFAADGVDRERYAARLEGQWIGCLRHLREDPDTREAIMTLQPRRSAEADGGRDFPCTTSIQVLLREGRLHMVVGMRSNDVWHGLSGDAFLFTTLQRTMAWILGVEPGTYIHNAASLHLYERDIPAMLKLHAPDREGWGAPGIVGDGPATGDLERDIVDVEWMADWIVGQDVRPPIASAAAERYRAALEKHL